MDIDISFGALSSRQRGEHSRHGSNQNKTNHYGSVSATFCPLDWRLQKDNPATVPMFRVLVANSKHCNPNRVSMDLREIVKRARLYDKTMEEAAAKKKTAAAEAIVKKKTAVTPGAAAAAPGSGGGITAAVAAAGAPPIVSTPVKTLKLGGFIFHESRCGSTLASNLLVASNPQAHRVYSESGPPITALRACDVDDVSCSTAKQSALLHDVMYLMSRSQSREETHVFFKIQSVGTHSMGALTAAFPTTPWIFVYRDPIEVLMSHLKHGGDAAKRAVCLRTKGHTPPNVAALIADKAPDKELSRLTNVEYCAAHLATLCQSALKEYHHGDNFDIDHLERNKREKDGDISNVNSNTKGKMVNYATLPDVMWESILPDHFDMDLPSHTMEMVDRMKAVSQVYSKSFAGDRAWEQDSERKQALATKNMKKATKLFLDSYFEQLEATNNANGNDGDNDDVDNKEEEENKDANATEKVEEDENKDVDATGKIEEEANKDADVTGKIEEEKKENVVASDEKEPEQIQQDNVDIVEKEKKGDAIPATVVATAAAAAAVGVATDKQ